jgi:hypothetical protein
LYKNIVVAFVRVLGTKLWISSFGNGTALKFKEIMEMEHHKVHDKSDLLWLVLFRK